MVKGVCKKCNRFLELAGGWCVECSSEAEAKKNPLNEKRERLSKEEMRQEMAEKRRDKSFWWG